MQSLHTIKSTIAVSVLWAATSSAALAQYYGHSIEEEAAPIREGEKAVIPLDTEDPTFNIWREPRDDLQEGRKPGPINMHRFKFGRLSDSVPSFFGQPFALTQEDLLAGDVDVAIIGATTDNGSGARGAGHGPNAFRTPDIYGGYGAR